MADLELHENTEEKGLVFDVLIKNKLKAWRDAYDDDNRYRVTEYVTMVRRDRSDYFGNFDDQWLNSRHPLQMTWKPMSAKGMVTYPVIRRSVNAKISTEMATQIKLTIEPQRKDPVSEAVASMARKIESYLRRKIWHSQFDYDQSKMRQLGRLAYIHTSSDKEGGVDIKFPQTVEKPRAYGSVSFACDTCKAQVTPEELGIPDPIAETQGRLDSAFQNVQAAQTGVAMAPKDANMPQPDANVFYDAAMQQPEIEDEHFCPMCSEQGTRSVLAPTAEGLEYRMEPFHDGTYSKKNTGTIKSNLVSPLNTRVDEFGAMGFKFHDAHWFCYRFLMPTYQVKGMCKDQAQAEKLSARNPDLWSDAVRWGYELMKKFGNVVPNSYDSYATHLTEVEIWWIQPVACDGWKSPSEYECGPFRIKRNQTIEEAFLKQPKRSTDAESKEPNFDGLGVMLCGEEILKVFNEDFRKKWTAIAWTPDPHAYFPQGEERLLPLQDACTRSFTLVYSHSQRASAPRVVVNRVHFTKDDLKANVVGGTILTKAGSNQPADIDLRRHIFTLKAGELPAMFQPFLEMLITIVKEETGIYDETVGAGSSYNKTASGREVALNRSLGLQLPQMRSKGEGLKEVVAQWLEHAQEMEDEFFLLFIDEDEEEWTQTDLENYRAANFRKEYKIEVVEGSDIPRTRADLEEAYLAAINEGIFDPNSPIPLNVRAEILKMRGIDYDLQDYDSNQRVANIRYDHIRSKLVDLDPTQAVVLVPVIDPQTQMPAVQVGVDGQPGEPILQPSLNPRLLADLMQDPMTAPQEFSDNHFIFIDFLKKKLYGVIGAKEINVVLMLGINSYITAHRGYIAAELSRNMQLQSPPVPGDDPNAEGGDKGKKPGEKKGPPR